MWRKHYFIYGRKPSINFCSTLHTFIITIIYLISLIFLIVACPFTTRISFNSFFDLLELGTSLKPAFSLASFLFLFSSLAYPTLIPGQKITNWRFEPNWGKVLNFVQILNLVSSSLYTCSIAIWTFWSFEIQGVQEKLCSFQDIVTSPSPALASYWLCRKWHANRSDCTFTMRWDLIRSFRAICRREIVKKHNFPEENHVTKK